MAAPRQGIGQGERGAIGAELRRLAQRPGIALGRCNAQRGDLPLPALAVAPHIALQGDARHAVGDVGIQPQGLHRATRLHAHAIQHHAGFDGGTLQGQLPIAAAPRQPATQADALRAIGVPTQAIAGNVGGDVGRVALAADLQLPTHHAGGAGQHVVQLQRLQLCSDVELVAQLALGIDAAIAQRQLQLAFALFAAQREFAIGRQRALTQLPGQAGNFRSGFKTRRDAARRCRQLATLGRDLAG